MSEERGALHSASLTVGKTGTSSGGGGIKKSIGSVTKPGSEEGKKADSTEKQKILKKLKLVKKLQVKKMPIKLLQLNQNPLLIKQ